MSCAANRPKVLLLFNRIPFPLNNGGAIAMHSVAKEYAMDNCEVDILCMNTARHFVSKDKAGSWGGNNWNVSSVYVDNNLRFIGALQNLFETSSYILQRFVSKEYDERLKTMLQTKAYDVIHADALTSLLYLNTIRANSNAKVLYRAQNIESDVWNSVSANLKNPLRKWYLKLQTNRLENFEWEAVNRVDGILSISDKDVSIFKEKSSAPVWHHPVYLEVQDVAPPDNEVKDLFFLGALDWFPNIEGLLWFLDKVWPQVHKEFPELKFYVAGKSMPENLQYAKRQGVVFLGEVEDAQSFMLNHGVMVAPILSGSGIRMKIAEAMALGKTVLSTDVAAEGLSIENGVHILIANTASEFISQLKKCELPEFKKRIGLQAHSFAKQTFSKPRIGIVLDELLQR
jgi:glycosyltransferase involved in cell wall biosynthesis